jgi:hypothetical protein
MNLREDKGYSYGARGGFLYSPKAYGMLTVVVGDRDKVEPALDRLELGAAAHISAG